MNKKVQNIINNLDSVPPEILNNLINLLKNQKPSDISNKCVHLHTDYLIAANSKYKLLISKSTDYKDFSYNLWINTWTCDAKENDMIKIIKFFQSGKLKTLINFL